MKENKYDEHSFFEKYTSMQRSLLGLEGAGEWHALKTMLPDFEGKRVLDLGCGLGWHCKYSQICGATKVTGIDISRKMIERARQINGAPNIEYITCALEDFEYQPGTYDIVLSSLAFHYIADLEDIFRKVHRTLTRGGIFVFSAEHPVFTAAGHQQWCTHKGSLLHWPVDNYFEEGIRRANFLGEEVVKYHRTLTGYLGLLLDSGFTIESLKEPRPDPAMMDIPGMSDELRRPMFIIVRAIRREK